MFNNTIPFGINDKLLIGSEVPEGAINIAHFNTTPLDSSQNLIISDNSGSIIENINQQQEIIMYANEEGQLVCIDENNSYDKFNKATCVSIINSELIMLTDKFKNDVPLYYRYKLKHLYFNDRKDLSGEYNGDSIILVDKYNKELLKQFYYKIVLEKTKMDNLYEIYIYTSFVIENDYAVKCIYNGADIKGKDIEIMNAIEEFINPQIYYKKAASLLEMNTQKNRFVMRKSDKQIRSSEIFVGQTVMDSRNPQRIKVSAHIIFEDGSETTIDILNENDNDTTHYVYNRKSILPEEEKNFIGEKQQLTSKTIKEICKTDKKIISVKLMLDGKDKSPGNLTLYTKPDGTGKVYAKTTVDTGKYSTIPDKYYVKNSLGHISNGYAIKFKDRNPIKILYPRERKPLENWYIRIQNGMFSYIENRKKYTYYIPEYYTQLYSKEFGKPYKDVKNEEPMIISNKSIKLKNTPVFIIQDNNGVPTNIKVYKIDALNNKIEIKIDSWNDKNGIINLKDTLSENDKLLVNYIYEEQTFVYRGYYDNTQDEFILLDCNPNKNHFLTCVTENGVYDVPTFNYIDGMIYIYLRPALIEECDEKNNPIPQTRINNNKVIFHTMERLDKETIEAEKIMLLGVIYIRPNSSFYNLQITDTRSRGGGILEEISDKIRKELEPESDYYWDIGYWDGEQYSNNNVIVVRLDKRILKENGGRLTEQEVEAAVNKHASYGSLMLIEYVDTFNSDQYTIKNAEIKVEHLNKLNFTPEIFCDTEVDIHATIVDIVLDRGVEDYKPEFVDIVDDDMLSKPVIFDAKYYKRHCDLLSLSLQEHILEAKVVELNIFDENYKLKPSMILSIDKNIEEYKPGLYIDCVDSDTVAIERPKFVDLLKDNSKYKPNMTLSSFVESRNKPILYLDVETESSPYEKLLKPQLFLNIIDEKENEK